MNLAATASSGLPVAFSIASGNGQLDSNVLRLNYEGLLTIRLIRQAMRIMKQQHLFSNRYLYWGLVY